MKLPYLSTLTTMALYVNQAIAEGYVGTLTFHEVYENVEQGTMLDVLHKRIPAVFDSDIYKSWNEEVVSLHNALRKVSRPLIDHEQRRFGISSSGLHLLMGILLEAIRQHTWSPFTIKDFIQQSRT